MIRLLLHARRCLSAEILWGAIKAQCGLEPIEFTETEEYLVSAIERTRPEVILFMPEVSEDGNWDLEVISTIRLLAPTTCVIVLCERRNPELVISALQLGARGVFSIRESSLEDLEDCVGRVHRGQVWASWQDIEWLLQAGVSSSPKSRKLNMYDASGNRLLSQREEEVVSLLVSGLPNREIAHALRLGEHTIKNYLFHIYDKLGISSRTELLLYVMTPRDADQAAASGI